MSTDAALARRNRAQAAMDRVLVAGIAWTAMAKWTTQILTWASTLVVARILAPEDFGLLAMALAFLGFIALVNEFGLGAAVVQRHDIPEESLCQLATLSLILGIGFACVSAALSGVVASFFGEPAIQLVIMVMSLSLVIGGMQVIPRAILTRELRFKELAIIDGFRALTAAGVTLSLALAGYGYWSLVLGNVIAKLFETVAIVVVKRQRLTWPTSIKRLLPEIRFGGHMTFAGVGWYVWGTSDSVAAGRLLGPVQLGAYGIAVTLAFAPVVLVTGLMSRVSAAVFASVQKNAADVRRYTLLLTRGQAFLVFPSAAGMVLVAPDFVQLVLGEQWTAAVVPIQILSVCAALRCLGPVLIQALVYTGRPEINSRITLIGAVTLPPLFIAGTWWGIDGVAAGWLLGYGIIVLPLILYNARRHLELSAREYFGCLVPPAVCTATMMASVLAAHFLLPITASIGARLGTTVATGVVVYSTTVFLLYRTTLSQLYRTLVAGRAPSGLHGEPAVL